MKIKTIVFIILVTVLSCKNDKEESNVELSIENNEPTTKLSPNRPNLNISILLDLSDRIDPVKYPNPAMEFYERDLGYIHSVVESFEWHLRNKRSIKIKDHIQLFIEPEPADGALNSKIQSLNMSFTKDNAKKEYIMQTSGVYDSIVKQIYQSAIEDNNYVGSDVWGFFKNNVQDFCVEEDFRNILVVLTDGYLYHKDVKIKEKNLTSYLRPQDIREFKLNKANWKERMETENFGFIPMQDDLKNIEVLVLGINPDKKNDYEQDVIFKYWKDWLTQMNVKQFEIKLANLPANMDKVIKDYIFQE
ncbi:hypothetical protein HNV10_12600 [Winogradskyella litoriviva]|uniref:VWFA domain-containing protein n=1 Tax=Winogradskyella litoriviva TaxID=1220182 RepID=A0ABX2E6Y5_9FLAO|nr:hypothetical protein [Winogradskyella litoriviva]NRD24092.1 hypothetical protein [Winogradskyella litoriviva]